MPAKGTPLVAIEENGRRSKEVASLKVCFVADELASS
jgi:hypothetical protein